MLVRNIWMWFNTDCLYWENHQINLLELPCWTTIDSPSLPFPAQCVQYHYAGLWLDYYMAPSFISIWLNINKCGYMHQVSTVSPEITSRFWQGPPSRHGQNQISGTQFTDLIHLQVITWSHKLLFSKLGDSLPSSLLVSHCKILD